ncbi:MAG: hypothetical protein Q8J89_09100, partial [Caulobacter sp.]|nr:hypothetical protein [Caulobacter sp.]
MEPPSKDDPANPYGFRKAWGKQPQGAFRIGPLPKAGAAPIRMPAPPPTPTPKAQSRPIPEPTPQRPSSILTGSAAAPTPQAPFAAPLQPIQKRPPRPTGPTVRPESMPLGAAAPAPRPASPPRPPAPEPVAVARPEPPVLA